MVTIGDGTFRVMGKRWLMSGESYQEFRRVDFRWWLDVGFGASSNLVAGCAHGLSPVSSSARDGKVRPCMAFCGKCGSSVAEGVAFCPHCGAAVGAAVPPPPPAGSWSAPPAPPPQPAQAWSAAPPPAQSAEGWSAQPPPPPPPAAGWAPVPGVPVAPASGLQENLAGCLCYALGWLTGIIFLLIDRRPFVRFHAAQSIVVFGALTILRFVLVFGFFGGRYFGFFSFVGLLSLLVSLATLVAWLTLMTLAIKANGMRSRWRVGLRRVLRGILRFSSATSLFRTPGGFRTQIRDNAGPSPSLCSASG